MIILTVWIGKQRRALYLRWNGWSWEHNRISSQARIVVTPIADYYFGRTQASRIKIALELAIEMDSHE